MHRCAILAALALLGACMDERRAARRDEADPIVVAALADPLMVDPDLTSQSNASAALGGGGPALAEIPRELRGLKVAAVARAEAEALVGARIATAPLPAAGAALPSALTAPAFAALMPGAKACAAGASYGFIWAAALPAEFPVYPRGHAQVAAGNDLKGCRLRAVLFTTPVPPEEVAAFYLARGKAAALPLALRQGGEALVLEGSNGKAAVLIKTQLRSDGLSEVWIATSGL